MQTSIECPVCFNVYAPRSRQPKFLITCGHGVCQQCVRSLLSRAKGFSINCPKCRTECEIPEGKPERLPTMYPLLELIDSLCGECRERPHTQKCGHCPHYLCDTCWETHLSGASSTLVDDIKELEHLMADVTHKLADRRDIQVIHKKGEHLKKRMKQTLDEQILQLRTDHEKKIAAVDAEITRHTDMVMEWRRNSRQLCADCDMLLDKLRCFQHDETHEEVTETEQVDTHQQELKEKIKALKYVQSSKPDVRDIQISTMNEIECQRIIPSELASQGTQTDDILPDIPSQNTQTCEVIPATGDLIPDYSAAAVKATFDKQKSRHMGISEDPTTGNILTPDYMKHEVVVLTSELQMVRRLGDIGAGHKIYKFPWSILAAGECMYVSDTCNHRIHVTDLEGTDTYSFGSAGSGKQHFSHPRDLCIDSEGHLYVCDGRNKRVKVVDARGKFIREFGRGVLDDDPLFITISAHNTVAVSTTTGANIYMFRTVGQHIKTINIKVAPHNIHARGVTFDCHGHILVSDGSGGRVAVITESGDVVGFIGSRGSGPGQLKGPEGLTVTSNGDVAVCDTGNARIQLFEIPKRIP